ncbi:MAG: extracellular solute-binding protein [Pseudomonadota bacterium]
MTGWVGKFRHIATAAGFLAVLSFTTAVEAASVEQTQHGIAMHGKPALSNGFSHLPYANPDAPKGGRITYSALGSFDSVNPFILKGQKVRGLRDPFLGHNVYESLLFRSRDEPFTLYGLLAESLEVPDDRSSITFHLNKKARFSDGAPVTADDVIFSVELLAEKGRPNYRRYYGSVERVEKLGDHSVRFLFKSGTDRELALLLGLMPILPKHAVDAETFDQTTLDPFIGSGPYVVSEVEQGSHILLTKDPDYWAKDLPVKRGFDNFDEIRIDYYRDGNALFEAFKKGLVDVYFEGDPTRWKTGYDGRAIEDGRIVQSEFFDRSPKSVRGYAFNTRRAPLNDVRVRQALSMLFDFEWINANLFSDGFTRTESFFQGSELSAIGRPASDWEREFKPLSPASDAAVFDGSWRATVTDGSGRDRTVLRAALNLLREAGFALSDGVLIGPDGSPLSIELLYSGTGAATRLGSAYQETLRLLGVELVLRSVDAAQFEERRKSYDFDLIAWTWGGTLSPGNEQYFRWGSTLADEPGSFNLAGVKDEGVDQAITTLVAAKERERFVDAARLLDRYLISGHYVLFHYHLDRQLVAHDVSVGMPDEAPLYGVQPSTWWKKDSAE